MYAQNLLLSVFPLVRTRNRCFEFLWFTPTCCQNKVRAKLWRQIAEDTQEQVAPLQLRNRCT